MSREALKVLCICLMLMTALLILDDSDEKIERCQSLGNTLNECNQLLE